MAKSFFNAIFELKMLKLLENHVKTKVYEGFSHFLIWALIFDQKVPKKSIIAKKIIFWHFLVKLKKKKKKKQGLYQKMRKPLLDICLNMIKNGFSDSFPFQNVYFYIHHSYSLKRYGSTPTVRGVEWVHGLFLFPLVLGKNVVATCKIGSFLCSLDNLLQKNVIVFFLEIKFQNGAHLKKKRAIFDLLFTFSVPRQKLKKNPSAHISLTYIHVFCSPY